MPQRFAVSKDGEGEREVKGEGPCSGKLW